MSEQLKASIVRIFEKDNRTTCIGVGFLSLDRYVLTCAHVITQSLHLQEVAEMPSDIIYLDFPLSDSNELLKACVVCWHPEDAVDMAVLELVDFTSVRSRSVRLMVQHDLWGHPFRAFGFPVGYDKGVWASGVMRDRQARGWIQLEAVNVPGHRVAQGFSGTPVWDEQLDGVVGMVVEADMQTSVKTAYIIPTALLIKAWPNLGEQAIAPCPYQGLFAFREANEPYFFGRETYVQQLIEMVHNKPLVMVVGPSGSGKTSVVFAGFLPHLRRMGDWLISSFRPGDQPFYSLASALITLLESQLSETDRLIEIKKLAVLLQNGEIRLLDVTKRLMQKYPDMRILLIADQFEELYTLCSEIEIRQRFLDQLLSIRLLSPYQSRQNIGVVFTLRADFLGYALSYRPFADALQNADLKLGPMSRRELQDAIEKPAGVLKVQIEDGLVERILNLVSREPGSLPLLEFALTLLWKKQFGSKLTLAAYKEIGGLEYALTTYAEEIYNGLNKEEQKQARRLFVQLVRPGEGTEDTRRLAARSEVGEETWNIVVRLSDARLVVSGQDEARSVEIVEVVHETLIRGWERLHQWMEAARNFRIWQERLRTMLRHWESSGKQEGALLRGSMLVEATHWLQIHAEDISSSELEFIETSQQYEIQESQRWKKLYEEAEKQREKADRLGRINRAIYYVSSAIAGPFALPQVLDRILQVIYEFLRPSRCAILLLEDSISGRTESQGNDAQTTAHIPDTLPRITIAAQKGLHLSSQSWQPQVSEQLLLGRMMQIRRSLVIPNAHLQPEIEFPLLDDNGTPCRPGSIACVPIFEPVSSKDIHSGTILGSIEIYYQHVHGFPAEEVELLEQFAPQVGLAIQNARFFLTIDRHAREARRQARQRENVMRAIPDGVILYNARWRVADINSTIRQLLGWSDDVIGLHFNEALARSTATFLDKSLSFQDMVAELEQHPDENRVDEFKMIGADGKLYIIHLSKAPISDEQGNIFAYVMLYHDVTLQATAREQFEKEVIARTAELAQRNQALEEAQIELELEHNRLDLLLAHLPSGVLLVSASDNSVIISNRQAAQLLRRMGWKPANGASDLFDDPDDLAERIIGMNIEELFRGIKLFGASGQELPYEKQPLYFALHKGEASEAELHFIPSEGTPLYLLTNAAPLLASDGTITNAVLVLQDLPGHPGIPGQII